MRQNLRIFRLSAAWLVVTLLMCLTPAAQESRGANLRTVSDLPGREKRWALIIGVDSYHKDISPLYGSVNDAKALKDVLVKYAGFPESQIILMTTDASDTDLLPTRGNILDALDRLSREVPESGLLLFSFSGHGLSIGRDAFIVPSDGKIYQNPELMRERTIDVLRIKDAIQRTSARQVLMLIDACRDYPLRDKGPAANPLTEPFTSGFSFDTRNSGVNAFATIYATSLGDRAFEFLDARTGQYRGYFSYAIERGLSGEAADANGEVTLAGLIKYLEDTVSRRVYVEKNQKQVPYPVTEGFRNSELVLAVIKRTAPSPASDNPKNDEAAYWQAIENSDDFQDFEVYLTKCQRGEFAGLYKATAMLKLYRLKKAYAPRAWAKFMPIAKRLTKYDYVSEFSEGLASVRLDDKFGFINRSGEEIVPPKYDFARSFSGGRAVVRLGSKWGLIDGAGSEVVTPSYDQMGQFSESLVWVSRNHKAGFIDRAGKAVIPLKYEGIESFSNGLAIVSLNGKTGLVDRTGREVVPPTYDVIEPFSEGLAAVGLNGKYGFIDTTGQPVIPLSFRFDYESFKRGEADDAPTNSEFKEGLAQYTFDLKTYGYVDRIGKIVIPARYNYAGSFAEGLAPVALKDKYGFIDKAGRVVVPFKYDDADSFSGGLAGVCVGREPARRCGYVNRDGREVVKLKYESRFTFNGEFALVSFEGKYGIIDRSGDEIIRARFDSHYRFANGLFAAKLNNRWGFVNEHDEEVTPFKYDGVTWCNAYQSDGFWGVELNGRKGFIDIYGNEYFDF